MKRYVVIKWLGIIGFAIIVLASAVLLTVVMLSSINSSKNAEALLTAFAGAFFAYVLLKIGESFTRISQREKLNLDTLVDLQYVLNDHLNRIAININLLEALRFAIDSKSPTVNSLQFKPMPINKVKLQDLKNADYINDVFNYFVDVERLDDGLAVTAEFTRTLIANVLRTDLTRPEQVNVARAYHDNAVALKSMIDDSEKLLLAADEECERLIALGEYVMKTRNRWLSLAIPWFNVNYYDQEQLKRELPKILSEVRKGRNKVHQSSIKKTISILGKDKNRS